MIKSSAAAASKPRSTALFAVFAAARVADTQFLIRIRARFHLRDHHRRARDPRKRRIMTNAMAREPRARPFARFPPCFAKRAARGRGRGGREDASTRRGRRIKSCVIPRPFHPRQNKIPPMHGSSHERPLASHVHAEWSVFSGRDRIRI